MDNRFSDYNIETITTHGFYVYSSRGRAQESLRLGEEANTVVKPVM